MEKRILAVLIAALAGGAYAQSPYRRRQRSSRDRRLWATRSERRIWLQAPPPRRARRSRKPRKTHPLRAARRRNPPADRNPRQPAAAAGLCRLGCRRGRHEPVRPLLALGLGLVRRTRPPLPATWCRARRRSGSRSRRSGPAPAPAPAPPPLRRRRPQPVVIEKISLNDRRALRASTRPSSRPRVSRGSMSSRRGAGRERRPVALTGHADRIGSEEYNQELSEQRAQAVADYLQSKGVDSSRLQVAGKGESEPVTGDQCRRMGEEDNKNQKLIACLQPDRRVDAELLGSREQTAGRAPGSTGAAGTTGTTGSSSGSASGTVNAPGSSGSSGYSGAGTGSPGSSGSSSSSESGSTTNK